MVAAKPSFKITVDKEALVPKAEGEKKQDGMVRVHDGWCDL